MLKQTFRGEPTATAVSDDVRDVDVELSPYRKLVETLPANHSRDGLEVQSADLTLILLRSLPQTSASTQLDLSLLCVPWMASAARKNNMCPLPMYATVVKITLAG